MIILHDDFVDISLPDYNPTKRFEEREESKLGGKKCVV
jgi:hypothetical protein